MLHQIEIQTELSKGDYLTWKGVKLSERNRQVECLEEDSFYTLKSVQSLTGACEPSATDP